MTIVHFKTTDDLTLCGKLYIPDENKSGKLPTVVLCQGLSGDKAKVLPTIAERLQKAGYLTIAFDYQSCGSSEGNKQELFPIKRVEDIKSAVRYMQTHPRCDKNKIALYGVSLGAMTAPFAASVLGSEIKTVFACSGLANGIDMMRCLRVQDDWIALKAAIKKDIKRRDSGQPSNLIALIEMIPFGNSFGTKYRALLNKDDSESIPTPTKNAITQFTLESAEAIIDFDLSSALNKLKCPIMVMHGELDDVIAIEDVRRCYQQIHSQKELITVPFDHIDFSHSEGLETQIKHALSWLNKTI